MSAAWCVVTVPTECEEFQVCHGHGPPSRSTQSSSSSSCIEASYRLKEKRCRRQRRLPMAALKKRPAVSLVKNSSSNSYGGDGYKSCPERQNGGGNEQNGNEPLLGNDSDSIMEQQEPVAGPSWLGLHDAGDYVSMQQAYEQQQPADRSKTSANSNTEPTQSLEMALRKILDELNIVNVFWSKDLEGRMLQARFHIGLDKKYEQLIRLLLECGIGERADTNVSVMNCLDMKNEFQPFKERKPELESAWDRFMDSVRCRLNVHQVVRQVRHDATITFDFLVLLTAAAVLACFGLVENSNMFLSSSMLISPLMGPIIASVFGTAIHDNKLCWMGIKNELFGIICVTFIGLLFGIAICFLGHFFVISEGLTQEILSRCETHSLTVGFFTALASGAAGAIGVLDGNIGSLVGVAISASLLPPAVNSGMLWALALGTMLFDENHRMLHNLVKQNLYSTHQSIELIIYASISMALTLVNIVCVWIMGVIVLRIKEIAPSIRASSEKFWKHDIRIARQSGYDSETQNAIDEFADQNKDDFLLDVANEQHQRTWSPGSGNPAYNLASRNRNYHTVHGFERLCMTLHQNQNKAAGTRETTTPSITVMDLFAQGPINGSQSTSFGKVDDAGALERTLRPMRCSSTQPFDRPKRRAGFKLNASSSVSMLNERKYRRETLAHKRLTSPRSMKNFHDNDNENDLAWVLRTEAAGQTPPAVQAPIERNKSDDDATITAPSAKAFFAKIQLERDNDEGANSSSEEFEV